MFHRVRKKPFLDHLHSGKKSCGNFDFSFVVTDSIFPECTSFSHTGMNIDS